MTVVGGAVVDTRINTHVRIEHQKRVVYVRFLCVHGKLVRIKINE